MWVRIPPGPPKSGRGAEWGGSGLLNRRRNPEQVRFLSRPPELTIKYGSVRRQSSKLDKANGVKIRVRIPSGPPNALCIASGFLNLALKTKRTEEREVRILQRAPSSMLK